MNRVFDISLNDIAQILRDKMSLLFLLIMPVGFTLMFGLAFGGLGQAPADPRLAVGILDQDHSPLSAALTSQLSASSGLRLEAAASLTRSELEAQVADGRLAAAVIVPAGYGAALQSGQSRPAGADHRPVRRGRALGQRLYPDRRRARAKRRPNRPPGGANHRRVV